MQLTASQEAAVYSDARNLQIVACAGSGKTEVLAQRVSHLLTRRVNRLAPENIVAIAYNNKAAHELRRRIYDRVTEQAAGPVYGMADLFVGTIHSYCLNLLTTFPEYMKFDTLDRVGQQIFIESDGERSGLTRLKTLWGLPPDPRYALRNYMDVISTLRESNLADVGSLRNASAVAALKHYRKSLHDNAYLDFDDQLLRAVRLLEDNEELRQVFLERVKCLLVDEYQDVNPMQECLIRAMHDAGAEVCVVGDDDQTIYQWRGADIARIRSFDQRYENVHQVNLDDNYRSSGAVVELARNFIERAGGDRLSKRMTDAGAQQL